MAKRSASSPRARRTAASAQPTTVQYRLTAAERARMARLPRLPQAPDEAIDYSDIPEATPGQLAAFRRPGRPTIGLAPRKAIALKVDRRVLGTLRAEAARRGIGYQTLMNDLLASAARRMPPVADRDNPDIPRDAVGGGVRASGQPPGRRKRA